MKFFKYTNKGMREVNEDSCYVSEYSDGVFACIADGVAGLQYGREASNFVTKHFEKYKLVFKESPVECTERINRELINYSREHFNGKTIGTTFTGCYVKSNEIIGTHVGDTRIYVLRGRGIKQLTQDHNSDISSELQQNIVSNYNYFNKRMGVLTHIMGSEDLFTCHSIKFRLENYDRIVLLTDGVYQSLSKVDIRDISLRCPSFEEFTKRLVLELGYRILNDNATFVALQI